MALRLEEIWRAHVQRLDVIHYTPHYHRVVVFLVRASGKTRSFSPLPCKDPRHHGVPEPPFFHVVPHPAILTNMIRVTDSAAVQLRELLHEKEAGAGLRLMVEKGGCAGLQYAMKVDAPVAGDEVIDHDGARVLVDAASAVYLRGSGLDYTDDLNDRGFKITNPNAVRSCGCGTSFEPAAPAATGPPLPEGEPCLSS
jgi:iron-sulfur cluster assembly accessory protein